jgi:hypothetical protein
MQYALKLTIIYIDCMNKDYDLKGVDIMKKIVIVCLSLWLSLVSAISVSATTYYTLSVSDDLSGMANVNGYNEGAVAADVNGVVIAGGITCTDINNTTYVPTSFKVTESTLSPLNLNSAMFSGTNGQTQLQMYEEAAWLNTQLHVYSNSTPSGANTIAGIQFAIWDIMAPTSPNLSTADVTLAQNWINEAEKINFSLYDFSSFIIYTPLESDGKYSNQEFISGGAVPLPVPEPGTIMLFGIGMLGIAIFGKRRMSKEC